MKSLKKIVCFLLVVLMAIPFAGPAFTASADESAATPAPGSVLYAENFETGTAAKRRSDGYADPNTFFGAGRRIEYGGGEMEILYHTGGSKPNYNASKDLPTIGDENNHLVTLINRTGASEWKGAYKEIIPAYAFAGVTNYTISFKIRTVNPSYYLEKMYGYPGTLGTQTKYEAMVADFAVMKDDSSTTANHVSFYNWKIYNTSTLLGGDGVTTYFESANSYDSNGTIGGTMKFVVTAGAGEDDATFAIYMNDVLVSTRSNARSGAPRGVILTLNNYIMQLDDLRVHDDVRDVDTYLEDFEPDTDADVFDDFYTVNADFTGTEISERTNGHSLLWNAYQTAYQGHNAGQFMASFAPAAQLQGAPKITVSFDATVSGYPYPHSDSTYTSYAYFHIGNNVGIETGNLRGVWIIFHSDSDGDMFELYNSGNKIASRTFDRFSVLEQRKHYTATYDFANRTFRMWIGNDLLFDAALTTSLNYVAEGDVMFGLNNRTLLELDNILVTAGSVEDRDLQISFKGTQPAAAVSDGKYAVRFVAGIGAGVDLSGIREIGFRVASSFGGGNVDYYAHNAGPCEYVYESILGSAEGSPLTYTAGELGSRYLIAFTIKNIPVSAGTVTFTVAPYYITANGMVSDASYRVVCENNQIVSQTLSERWIVEQRFGIAVAAARSAYPSVSQTEIPVDGNAAMIYVSSTNLTEFNTFRDRLEAKGFIVSAENELGNDLFRTFTKQDLVINAGFDPAGNTARIVVERPGAELPITETFQAASQTVCSALLTQVGLNFLDYESGMSYLVRLRDGRFLVIDGGGNDYDEAEKLYDLLVEQNEGRFGGKPVIAAWFLTHAHEDHYEAFLRMAREHTNEVEIEAVVLNLASPDLITTFTYWDGSPFCEFTAGAASVIDSGVSAIPGAKIIYARTGQQFRIANATVDVWFTPEDMYIGDPNIWRGNDASVIYRLTCEGQTALFLADVEQDDELTQQTTGIADLLVSRYGNSLKSDIMQISHHGYSYSSHLPALFSRIDPDIVLWPSTDHWYHHFLTHPNNTELVGNADEIIPACHGTRVLALPYAAQPAAAYHYANGETIYAQDFETLANIRELGWQMNDNLETAISTPAVTLTVVGEDHGLRMQGGACSAISFLCPDRLRNVTACTVILDLRVNSLGEGFSIWYNDADSTDLDGRTLYGIGETGTFELKLVIDRAAGSTTAWINGVEGGTFQNASNDAGALIFLLEGADVFVGSVEVIAGAV